MSDRESGSKLRPIWVIPLDDETKARALVEEKTEEYEKEMRQKCVRPPIGDQTQSGYRPERRIKDESDKELAALEKLNDKGENKESDVEKILVEDLKVVGATNLDKDSNSDDWKESIEGGTRLPLLKNPLPTGVACCLTRFTNPF